MPLPVSGEISIEDLAAEFGGVIPHGLQEYYGVASGIPIAGPLSLSDFYGATSVPDISYVGRWNSADNINGPGLWKSFERGILSLPSPWAGDHIFLNYYCHSQIQNSTYVEVLCELPASFFKDGTTYRLYAECFEAVECNAFFAVEPNIPNTFPRVYGGFQTAGIFYIEFTTNNDFLAKAAQQADSVIKFSFSGYTISGVFQPFKIGHVKVRNIWLEEV